MKLHSYPSIFNIGHKAIADLFKTPVYIQEKVDGSQFSFGVTEDGEVLCRSKGATLNLVAPEKMFTEAINTVLELKSLLHPGWTYRGEYLKKSKHNTLVYNRVPIKHIILFDIQTGDEAYLPYSEALEEAKRIGLEYVPLIHAGMVEDLTVFRSFLETESVLGGQKIEGVVAKPIGYGLFGVDKKCLMGKFVSESFKEVYQGEWRKANPTPNDLLQNLISEYKTPARWQKAILHLKERGLIENSPKDIGLIMKEVGVDVHKECEEEIKQKVWSWAWPKIQRAIVSGIPEWYKEQLLKEQFEVSK